MIYKFDESNKVENNQKDIVEKFEKVKLEIDQSIKNFEAKVAEMISSKKLNDGSMITARLEDMSPFLPAEEHKAILKSAEEI